MALHDILAEQIPVHFVENQPAFQVLLENGLNQENPDLLDAHHCVPHPRVVPHQLIQDPLILQLIVRIN